MHTQPSPSLPLPQPTCEWQRGSAQVLTIRTGRPPNGPIRFSHHEKRERATRVTDEATPRPAVRRGASHVPACVPPNHRRGKGTLPTSLPVLLSGAKGGVVGAAALSPGQPALVETFDGRAGGRGVLAQLTGRWWWLRRRTTSDYLAWCVHVLFGGGGWLSADERRWERGSFSSMLVLSFPTSLVMEFGNIEHIEPGVMNTSSCCLTTIPEEDTFLLRRRLSLSQRRAQHARHPSRSTGGSEHCQYVLSCFIRAAPVTN